MDEKAYQFRNGEFRHLSVPPHVLRPALLKNNIDKVEGDADGMHGARARTGRRHALAVEDAHYLPTDTGDIILHHLHLGWGEILPVLGERRLRSRPCKDRLDLGQELIGVLAARQKIQLLWGVEPTSRCRHGFHTQFPLVACERMTTMGHSEHMVGISTEGRSRLRWRRNPSVGVIFPAGAVKGELQHPLLLWVKTRVSVNVERPAARKATG